jgi:hypothetical protein
VAYEHHVFISYRREAQWTPWTRDHLRTLIASYLQQELHEQPDIFVDEQILFGADYVQTLANALAKSRVLVPVFSGDYFASPWCVHELDLMLIRNEGNPGLVLPVLVHDCDRLPAPLDRIQFKDLKTFRITHLARDGQMYQDFSAAVRDFAPGLAGAIKAAPPFQDAWIDNCVRRFDAVYRAVGTSKTVRPRSFALPPKPPRLVLPRFSH